MLPHLRLPSLFTLTLSATITVALPAAEKLDLERDTPVAADQPVPIVDFFRNPAFQNPALSRDGTHVAAMVSGARDQTDLFVFEFETKRPQLWSAPAERDVLNLTWLDETRLVFTVGKDRVWTDAVMATNTARAGEPRTLFQQCGATLVGIPDANRLEPLYWVSGHIDVGDVKKGGVVRVNTELNTGKMTGWGDKIPDDVRRQMRIDNTNHVLRTLPLLSGEFTVRYLPDATGELAFAVNNSSSGIETLHRLAGDKWENSPVDLDRFEILGPGLQAGELLVTGPFEAGKPQPLQLLSAETGQPTTSILTDEAYDFNGWVYRHPDTHAILGANFHRDGPRVAWFDEGYRALQKTIDALFPGLTARVLGSDIADQNFLVGVASDRQPVVYYRFNAETKAVTPIKASRPWIDPARMRPVMKFKYKTAEGRALDAYVTLPAGATKESPVPLVVLPHDGPRGRNTWEFHAEAQFLASRGFAVLQPNYRGSLGYDWMFPYEDRWAYRKMSDDVTAATKALLGTGLIDRQRIAIMGTGFGATLALAGAVHEPALFKCAVLVNGIYDWERRMTDERYNQYNNPSYAVMRRWLGDPDTDKARFEEISPLRHVANTKAPVFIFHGREDPDYLVNQARALAGKLQDHGIPREVVVLGGERFSLAYLKNRVELYSRVLAFLEKHVGAK